MYSFISWISFNCWTQNNISRWVLVTRRLTVAIDLLWKSISSQLINILQNIFFSVQQKKETHTAWLTWKWGLDTHLASWRKSGSMTFTNSDGSITSRISSSSLRNITSFGLWVLGQYLRRAMTTCTAAAKPHGSHQSHNASKAVWECDVLPVQWACCPSPGTEPHNTPAAARRDGVKRRWSVWVNDV